MDPSVMMTSINLLKDKKTIINFDSVNKVSTLGLPYQISKQSISMNPFGAMSKDNLKMSYLSYHQDKKFKLKQHNSNELSELKFENSRSNSKG